MVDEPAPQVIAIIGAGVAGSVFALTILSNPILRQCYRPLIYERLPYPRPISPSTSSPGGNKDALIDPHSKATYEAGAAVALTSNALYPLYSLGLQSSLNSISCESERIKIWRGKGGGEGKYLNQINFPNWQEDLGTCMRVVERGELQRLVLEKVRELGGEVVWGMKLRNMKMMEGGGIKLFFEGGEEAVVGLVVGADGSWSNVRRHIISSKNEEGDERWKPEFAGVDAIYGISKAIEKPGKCGDKVGEGNGEGLEGDTHWVLLDSGIASTWALPEGRQFWTISSISKTPPERKTEVGETQNPRGNLYGANVILGGYGLEDTEEVLKNFENAWHPVVGNFGELMRRSERIVRTPLWYRAWEESDIGGKNVVVIGDAARLMLPTSGQGACFAIEDSTVLANALLNNPPSSQNGMVDFSKAIDEYVQARVPRSKSMTKQSYWMAIMMSWVDSWWLRWLVDLGTTWLPTGGNPKLNKGIKRKDPMGWLYEARFTVERREE